ncbi:MAG: transglycosylase SLT domain-containing protein [Bryobacterales bacterium]|nr:transglycosylase SLT domain-containing protein [Bryobacterales bacterium]
MALPLCGASLDDLTKAYRSTGSAPSRAALAQFAQQHASTSDGALAQLALAAGDLQANRHAEALEGFQAAARRLPELADMAEYGAARALVALGRKEDAVAAFERTAAHAAVPSPHLPWAALSAVGLLIEAGQGEAALRVATRFRRQVPMPQAGWLYGSALEAAGRRDQAALELQKLYYEYPRSEEARKAEAVLARLQPLPPVPAALELQRAQLLMEGGEGARAVAGLQAAVGQFSPADRERVLIRVGAARFYARDHHGVIGYMKTAAAPNAPDADAERLFYIVQSARRLNRYAEVDEAVRLLNERHPKSKYRMEALSGAGNRFLLANDLPGLQPHFAGCAEFAPHPEAALCHWKIAFPRYMQRQPDAARWLREHLEKFPGSDETAAALYFLGRLAERGNDADSAKAYYQTISTRFPNFYYAVVSNQQLQRPALAAATPSPAVLEFTGRLTLPKPGAGADFAMDEPTRLRLRRARLLTQAGLVDWAELDLRYGQSNGGKKLLLAMELSRMAQARGENLPALRAIKASAPAMLTWRLEDAPKEFWRLAYPLPFREPLERYAETSGLDPYIVAGLIRQESEFDPGAISRANARGLTQVMPATGREVSRRLGFRTFTLSLLHNPDSSLRIGITYLKQILTSFNDQWHLTLAAYNAGPGRAKNWLGWGEYKEAPEFIETIPFHETRNYVQTVLRNADIYRRIWSGVPRPPRAAVVEPAPAAPRAPVRAAAKPARRPAAKAKGKASQAVVVAAAAKRPGNTKRLAHR